MLKLLLARPTIRVGALAAVAAALVSVVACTRKPAAPPAPSANAWAVVDGREITGDDVDKAYRRATQSDVTASAEEILTTKLNLLNEMIVQDLMLAKASALKLEVPTTELDAAFAAGRKGIPDDAFQRELESRKLTAADMRDGLKNELLAQKVIEKEVTSKVTVSDEDVSR